MKHQETLHLIPGATNAVLLIHGIVGTPNHFVGSVPITRWIPEGYSVHNLLLPGHGGTVSDFAHSSGSTWRDKVQKAFLDLAENHERVYIVAHSMGTLFALELAVEFPHKIPAIFLLGVPMRPHLAPSAINSALRLALGKLRPGKPEMAILYACGTTPTWMLWKYIPWVPRFLDLFAQIRRTEKVLPQLQVPAYAYQSRRDELVSRLSSKVLAKYPVIRLHTLEDSTHFYYSPQDTAFLEEEFRKLIK